MSKWNQWIEDFSIFLGILWSIATALLWILQQYLLQKSYQLKAIIFSSWPISVLGEKWFWPLTCYNSFTGPLAWKWEKFSINSYSESVESCLPFMMHNARVFLSCDVCIITGHIKQLTKTSYKIKLCDKISD